MSSSESSFWPCGAGSPVSGSGVFFFTYEALILSWCTCHSDKAMATSLFCCFVLFLQYETQKFIPLGLLAQEVKGAQQGCPSLALEHWGIAAAPGIQWVFPLLGGLAPCGGEHVRRRPVSLQRKRSESLRTALPSFQYEWAAAVRPPRPCLGERGGAWVLSAQQLHVSPCEGLWKVWGFGTLLD